MIRTVQFVLQRYLGTMSQSRDRLYEAIPRYMLNKFNNSLQASHCMLYAINVGKIKLDHQEYRAKANILMHLRYDGSIGFPGGYVDEAMKWRLVASNFLLVKLSLCYFRR